MRTPLNPRSAGVTLIEVALSSALLGGVLGVAILVASVGSSAHGTASAGSGIDARANHLTERLIGELTQAGADTLFPDPGAAGTSELTFQAVSGFAAGAVTWGPTTKIAFEYEEGEIDNGLDDDGDGLIDEGCVVLTRWLAGNANRITLCNGVAELLEGETLDGDDDNGNGMDDERGFCIQRIGDVLVIRATLAGIDRGQLMARSAETSLLMRNQ